jgi:hypothetical protein
MGSSARFAWSRRRRARYRPATSGARAAAPTVACWWCGEGMEGGAVFLKLRCGGRLCCVECARALEHPLLSLS